VLGADAAYDLVYTPGANDIDRSPVTEKRIEAPQPRTRRVWLVHAEQVRPDALD